MDGARDICAEKRRGRKAMGRSKKEWEWEQEWERKEREEDGGMKKEVKKGKAHHVISGAYQHVDGKPKKKTRGRCSRLFTNTIGGLA